MAIQLNAIEIKTNILSLNILFWWSSMEKHTKNNSPKLKKQTNNLIFSDF